MNLRLITIVVIIAGFIPGAVAQSRLPDSAAIKILLWGKPSGYYEIKDIGENPVLRTNIPALSIVRFSYSCILWCSDVFMSPVWRTGNVMPVNGANGEIGFTITLDSVTFSYKGVRYPRKVYGYWSIRRRQGECHAIDPATQEKYLKTANEPEDDPSDSLGIVPLR